MVLLDEHEVSVVADGIVPTELIDCLQSELRGGSATDITALPAARTMRENAPERLRAPVVRLEFLVVVSADEFGDDVLNVLEMSP